MHTQMNINAMEDDSCVCVCVPHERTQTDADRLQKLEQHTKMEHAHPCVLFVLCQVRRLSLLFNSMEEGSLDVSLTHTCRHVPHFLSSYVITAAEGWKEKPIGFK